MLFKQDCVKKLTDKEFGIDGYLHLALEDPSQLVKGSIRDGSLKGCYVTIVSEIDNTGGNVNYNPLVYKIIGEVFSGTSRTILRTVPTDKARETLASMLDHTN